MIQNSSDTIKIIGLTGGIATGKSTVTAILREKGFPVIDADKIARDVVRIGEIAYNDIIKEFGKGVLLDNRDINRGKLGEIIFNNLEARKRLNSIVHPRVTDKIKEEIRLYSNDNKVIFLDIPLLIEEKEKLEAEGLRFNAIWVVYVTRDIQIRRLINRDKLRIDEAKSRIKSQMDIDEKRKLADIIIDNTGDIAKLEEKINELLKAFS